MQKGVDNKTNCRRMYLGGITFGERREVEIREDIFCRRSTATEFSVTKSGLQTLPMLCQNVCVSVTNKEKSDKKKGERLFPLLLQTHQLFYYDFTYSQDLKQTLGFPSLNHAFCDFFFIKLAHSRIFLLTV